jgi:hypothetical protein
MLLAALMFPMPPARLMPNPASLPTADQED